MDHDAARAPAIISVGIEREDLAAIAARRVDRALQFGEAALHELSAERASRYGDLDPGSGLVVVFPMRGEHDRVAKVAGSAEPQAIVEAFHRRAFADIDLVILRRHNSVRAFRPSRLSAARG